LLFRRAVILSRPTTLRFLMNRLKTKATDGRDPRELAAMDITTYLDDKEIQPMYVRTMFDVIAPGYDAFTRVFSFGMDVQWKSLLVGEALKRMPMRPCILDVACGTGDLGMKLASQTSPSLALGLDFSLQMLTEAKRRTSQEGEFFLAGSDMLHLCIRDGSVDVVSMGYGLRNAADPVLALREVARVLKPGGIFANLDFYQPAGRVWRRLFLPYIWCAGRLAGWLWHREPITYGYIAESIRRYLTIADFERLLGEVGFTVEWSAHPLAGAIGIHIARKLPNS